jgi:hypothetical protein
MIEYFPEFTIICQCLRLCKKLEPSGSIIEYVRRRVHPVEKELPTLPKYLSSLPIMSVVRVANVLYSVLSTIGLFLFRFFKNTFRSLYCLNFY